jgi:hypothetical protein
MIFQVIDGRLTHPAMLGYPLYREQTCRAAKLTGQARRFSMGRQAIPQVLAQEMGLGSSSARNERGRSYD